MIGRIFLFSLILFSSSLFAGEANDFLVNLKKTINNERFEFGKIERNLSSQAWVKEALTFMYSIDQTARKSVDKVYELNLDENELRTLLKEIGDIIFEIDSQNVVELKRILKIHNWMNISVFGEEYDSYAWILVQHADNDRAFQVETLKILTKLVLLGETSKQNYAYLFDRVAG